MKKISDLFTDEDKKQLSYLGSMLYQEPTEEEAEQQKLLDAMSAQSGHNQSRRRTSSARGKS
jgi:hypothetical protein